MWRLTKPPQKTENILIFCIKILPPQSISQEPKIARGSPSQTGVEMGFFSMLGENAMRVAQKVGIFQGNN
jgi:hypothetical protein